jgi:hypothetical protein
LILSNHPDEETLLDTLRSLPTPAARTPPASIPARVGKLLLAYGDVPKAGQGTELLSFPKSVGVHLRQLLSEAGYVTAAPHLGIFAAGLAAPEIAVTASRPRRTPAH